MSNSPLWFSGAKTQSKTHCAVLFLWRDSVGRVEAIRKQRRDLQRQISDRRQQQCENGNGDEHRSNAVAEEPGSCASDLDLEGDRPSLNVCLVKQQEETCEIQEDEIAHEEQEGQIERDIEGDVSTDQARFESQTAVKPVGGGAGSSSAPKECTQEQEDKVSEAVVEVGEAEHGAKEIE